MKVKIRPWGIFQEIIGEREPSMDVSNNTTVGALLNHLASRYGQKFRDELFQPDGENIKPYIKILHNGHGARLDSKLREGDVVAIFPPVGGGHSAIPGSGGLSFVESLKTNLPCLDVRIR